MPDTPWDAAWHRHAEMSRMIASLARYLSRQRRRGRTPASEAAGGLVIETGETEGLIDELSRAWSRDQTETAAGHDDPADPPVPSRGEIDRLANEGAKHGEYLPLFHVRQTFQLHDFEYDALLLGLAVELDSRFGRVIAYLNDHIAQTRPTLGLAIAFAEPARGADITARLRGEVGGSARPLSPLEIRERPLVQDRLIELDGDAPLPGRPIRVPRDVALRLAADGPILPDVRGLRILPEDASALDRCVVNDRTLRVVRNWSRVLREGGAPRPLIATGTPGSGRSTVVASAVAEHGVPVVIIDVDPKALEESLAIGRREARWHGAGLIYRFSREDPSQSGPDWADIWRHIGPIDGPLVLVVPEEWVEPAASSAPMEPAVVETEFLEARDRGRLWERLLPPAHGIDTDDLQSLAVLHRFTPRRIERAIRRTIAQASIDGENGARRPLDIESLTRSCRTVSAASMGHLAQKLRLPFRREDLIVPTTIEEELDLAAAWIRHRDAVIVDWGLGRRIPLGHGLSALFGGPPGTGKTMAAQVLARELALDLYRVDLSRIMSKYIGETERNLAQLFDEARNSNVVLFFDEADALFGKRSEVKDARDRYANAEVGYLLQRLEEHDGVTVLASNRMRDMDDAFLRRFQIIAEFPMPDAENRLRIWRNMLPKDAQDRVAEDLERIARSFEVSGGEIKNAVLAAAYLAAAEGTTITRRHLAKALRREIGKSGRVVDEREFRALETN